MEEKSELFINCRKLYNCIPYSKKLTRNDFNAKVINAEEINAVEELLLYFFNKINAVSTSGFQIIWN